MFLLLLLLLEILQKIIGSVHREKSIWITKDIVNLLLIMDEMNHNEENAKKVLVG